MSKFLKIILLVGSLAGMTLFFQNCKVTQDEQGQVKSIQNFPQSFDRITLSEEEVQLDETTKNEILSLYKTAKLCVTILEPKPDTLCTLELRPNDYLKIYSNGKKQLSATLLGKTCGVTGAIDELCEGGPDLHAKLRAIYSEVILNCR